MPIFAKEKAENTRFQTNILSTVLDRQLLNK